MTSVGQRIRKRRLELGLSVDELADRLGKNRATVYRYESNAIENLPVTVIGPLAEALHCSPAELMGWDQASQEEKDAQQSQKMLPPVKIPVYARVAAGFPSWMTEEIIDFEEISGEMALNGEHYAVRIRGDSMAPRIQDGDIVICRKQKDADSGDVVIAAVNGDEATCKRIYKYMDGIRLVPNNPAYEPMFFSEKEILENPVTILGKVVELRGKP